jgi:pimeloyl-ACP methyl ester carboxylesterase
MSQSGFVEINGIRMHYKEWGNTDNPDVLLIHGWTSNSASWNYIAENIQDKYHLIAPDHRGHGASGKPATGYYLRNFVDDICMLMDVLELDKPLIAGNSWGGCIGTILAADYSDQISRAFLGDPPYWKMLDAFVTRLPDIINRRKLTDEEVTKDLQNQGKSTEQIKAKLEGDDNFSLNAVTRLISDNRDFAIKCEDYIRRIQVPTMIIAGEANAGGYILDKELEHYREIASPMVRFTQWHGAGHLLYSEEPDRYIKEMLNFFED